MKQKIMAWFLIFSMGMTSVSIAGQTREVKTIAEETESKETVTEETETAEEEIQITEVSDFSTFLEAAAEEIADDPAVNEKNPWQNKRLLVKSEEEFDVMGAESVITGYDSLFVLSYSSQEETKAAYEALKKIPGLTVEADQSYETTAAAAETGAAQNEGFQSQDSKSESTPSNSKMILAAVLDTGYDEKGGRGDRVTKGIDLTGGDRGFDENGHGTAMANIILDHTPDCVRVMPVKAADETGKTSALKLYLGICYAMEHGADIINISMSAYKASGSDVVQSAICRAREKGIFVVVSAGNAGEDVRNFSPANVEEAIVVSAVDAQNAKASYSNYGETLDYCAYGAVHAACLNGEVIKQEGTSVSAAIVSAVIATQKACKNDSSYEEMIETLNGMAKDLGDEGKDPLYGNGLLVSDSLELPQKPEEDTGKKELPEILSCDWKHISIEELNCCIGNATNLERRVFLDRLSEEEKNQLLSMDTLFSEKVIYSEHSFDESGNETEIHREEGRLYDIVTKGSLADEYEIQAQKYHVFAYGSNVGTRSCIKLDTSANQNDAVIYCWMKDRSTDNQNSGEYGITFVKGNSAFDFGQCTHKIENCDSADSGNPVVWRLKIRNVKAEKPVNYALNYSSDLWNRSTFQITGEQVSGLKKHYWYVFNYQVKPASGAARQKAYADGFYHGGFWDLSSAAGKKCGKTELVTTVDIGSRDLYTDENKDGIVYRLPLTAHNISSSARSTENTTATCLRQGSQTVETTYSCSICDRTWTESASRVIPRLAHHYIAKTEDDNGIPKGKYWEECSRNCRGTDVNGAFWQRNIKFLHPIRYWEMNPDGSYEELPTGTDRGDIYYVPGETIPIWKKTPSEEFQKGALESSVALAQASYQDVYIPRKEYRVVYIRNGAVKGATRSQRVYCGQVFDLRENGFEREGYRFLGWGKSPGGGVTADKSVKNLSLIHNDQVFRYALWEPGIFKIRLDNQGANLESGTGTVFEHYARGYYADDALRSQFWANKIKIPEKERKDTTLPEGIRKQQFDGYYTKKAGEGFQVIKPDGFLNTNINHAGDYKYFTKNSTVYANWKDMSIVQFDPNLSEEDMKLIEKDETGSVYDVPVLCPKPRWKEEGEDIIVSYGKAVVKNKDFSDLYRFKGWSLTPEITSDEEIILSEEKRAHTFTADADIRLYAQWETNFVFAYIGNEQSKGTDYLEEMQHAYDDYAFPENRFEKTVQKPVVDIVSGQTENEKGEPYMETIPCSFQGYSMRKAAKGRQSQELYHAENGELRIVQILQEAREIAKEGNHQGLTFGAPASDYGTYPASAEEGGNKTAGNEILVNEKTPFVSFYAVWDQYPQIQAADLYLPLSDAREGVLTEEYLLNMAKAIDEELKSDTNREGVMKAGRDKEKQTSFTIPDYQASEFTDAENEMSITITYRAEDAVGNVTTKTIRVHLADISGKKYETGQVRFISEEHIDTLAENSIWRTGKYAEKLAETLGNKKTGEEYTAVTPLQQAFGARPVLKPGSGVWDHVQEVWEFDHEEVEEIQSYMEQAEINADPQEFLNRFGYCRIQ